VIDVEYKWVVLMVTTVGSFLTAANSGVVIIALPQILADLHASLAEGVWMIAVYQFVITILALALGRFADLYGRAKLYTIGYIVFSLGTGLSAIAFSGLQLILFRGLQGLGAAFIIVNGMSLVADAFPLHELGMGIGINFMASSVGSVMGYVLGGALVTYSGWRTIFLFIIAVSIFGTLWSHRRLHEVFPEFHKEPFDLSGTALYVAGLTVILLGLTLGAVTQILNLTLLASGFLFFMLFVFLERNLRYPVLDLGLFRNRQFAFGNLAGLLTHVSAGAFPLLVSFYLQFIRGLEPIQVGLLLLWGEIVVAVLTVLCGHLSDTYGSRPFVVGGSIIISSGLALFSFVDRSSPTTLILGIILLLGVGRGLFGSSNAGSVMSAVVPESHGIANGVRSTVNNTANLISVPLVTALMTIVLPYERVLGIVTGVPFTSEVEILSFMRAISFSMLILAFPSFLATVPNLAAKSRSK